MSKDVLLMPPTERTEYHMSISNLTKLESDLDLLVKKAHQLYYSMANECNLLNPKKDLKGTDITLVNFKLHYETWYTESLQVVKQIVPDRYNDFIQLYKIDKRKEITYATYTISDYMLGLQVKHAGAVSIDTSAALPKMFQQGEILRSVKKRFKSSLFNIRQIIQADLFDNELQCASEILSHGFIRGAGVIAGVVLEKHLSEVCDNHALKIAKKNPTIADFNEVLKNSAVYDIPEWRFIQRLGDIRNLCGHNKDREPSKDEASELIIGVDKITKTIY